MTTSDPLHAQTIGGEQLLDEYSPASGDPSAPVCVVLPALGIAGSYYTGFGRALAERGLRAIVADNPGLGRSPLRAARGVDWGYADLVRTHVPAVLESARSRYPEARLVIVGHSIGGQMALMHLGREPESADAVIVIASGSAHALGWEGPRRFYMHLAPRLCAWLSHPLGYFPGHRVGFGGREAATLIREWACAARTGRYTWPSLDGDATLPNWSGPTLAIPLAGDVWAPRAAMAHTLDKTSADVLWRPWTDPAPPGHNRWPRMPGPPADAIRDWLAELGISPGAP